MYPFHGPSAWFVYVLESGIPRKSFNGRIVFFYVKIITSRRKNYFTLIALLIKHPWYTEIYPLHTQTIQYPSKFDGLYLTRNDGQMHRSILFYLHLLISGLHHHFSIQCHHPPLAGDVYKRQVGSNGLLWKPVITGRVVCGAWGAGTKSQWFINTGKYLIFMQTGLLSVLRTAGQEWWMIPALPRW